MSYHLFVRLTSRDPEAFPDPGDRLYDWELVDASGDSQLNGAGDTQQAIEDELARNNLDQVRLVGLVPGDDVLLCYADIPAKQSRFIRQALPYAVEEQLAQDVDSMHLALGGHTEHGYRVAAIDHSRMAAWHTLFNGWDGARLAAIFPEPALLPLGDHDWCLCLDGNRVLALSREGQWFSMAVENLPVLAQTLAVPDEEQVSSTVSIRLIGMDAALAEHDANVRDLEGNDRLAIQKEATSVPPLRLMAQSWLAHHGDVIDLCQGSFSSRGGSRSQWRVWRPAAVIAAVWFIAQVGVEVGMGYYHQQQADRLNQQAMAIYRDAFPQDRRATPNNVRRILKGQFRQAEQSSGGTAFLPLLRQAGAEYDQLGGAEALHFGSLNYSRQRGELVIELRASNYDRMSQLRSALAQKGLSADIGSVVNEDDGTRGRLTVSGG
ncbi:type II secretion system protein L (GspL) [Tamilnaduibacter salinus]|uniref:Type II secretion system protein L n=1 Tax=Tamilnaduibacter salinus TaxID=1484056 RepID=A0A2A2I1Z2_9GAMM|nr:type II secretion system protein GspL [Tamilnaduibacter salinus]PAV25622.1 type II secretion system protein GspL [Tamilnaduibacter salinus]PVY78109.1 type II secretion system protein L (GspL) [Tamilnaduibacter salinus]